MFHLIYTSQARQSFAAADLKRLLTRSRLNNGDINVTGMLIYRDGVFLQALEGNETSVRKVFKRLENDPRHTGVKILRNGNSFGKRRIFGEWSMGFINPLNNAQVLKGFVDLPVSQDLLTLDGARAMQLLSACGGVPKEAHA